MPVLAGLLGRVRIDPAALPAGQRAQRAGGQFGAQRQRHPGREQAVPAEQGQVPRCPGAEEVILPAPSGRPVPARRGRPPTARAGSLSRGSPAWTIGTASRDGPAGALTTGDAGSVTE